MALSSGAVRWLLIATVGGVAAAVLQPTIRSACAFFGPHDLPDVRPEASGGIRRYSRGGGDPASAAVLTTQLRYRRRPIERAPMPTLTPQQCAFYAIHGFLLVRGYLSPEQTRSLAEEVEQSLMAAHSRARSEEARTVTGDESHYLPLMGDRSPNSRALASDSQLVGAARQLLGRDVMVKPAKGNIYHDATFWHADTESSDLRGVKVVTYFSPLDRTNGALQVLPGSHRTQYHKLLSRFRKDWPWSVGDGAENYEEHWWPGVELATVPGDVIFFDVHLWHAALHGRSRVQWSASYVATPETGAQRVAARNYILSFLDVGHDYDEEAYPYFDPDWLLPDYDGPFVAGLAALDLVASDHSV